jgi:peptide deformylase
MDPVELAQELVRIMIDSRGYGLAANQLGVPYRVFAMFTQPENTVCFNPRIVDVGEETVDLEEGCLSYPGLLVKIKRPKNIKVRFAMPNGEVRTDKYTGITARCFLHELDHLNGLPFWHGSSRTKFDAGRKKAKVNVTYNGKIYGAQSSRAESQAGEQGLRSVVSMDGLA